LFINIRPYINTGKNKLLPDREIFFEKRFLKLNDLFYDESKRMKSATW